MAFGDPAADPKKPVSRTAKMPDEVVDLFALPDGSTLVVETFLDNAYQLPMGDAIAMRHLSGAVRLSQVRTNDSLGWQHIAGPHADDHRRAGLRGQRGAARHRARHRCCCMATRPVASMPSCARAPTPGRTKASHPPSHRCCARPWWTTMAWSARKAPCC